MKAEYVQRGDNLDYLNGTDTLIEAGTVLKLVSRIVVAGCDIPVGETGSVHTTGTFTIAKSDAGAIKMGTPVYLSDAGITATAESNTPAGFAAADSAAADTTILVKIG